MSSGNSPQDESSGSLSVKTAPLARPETSESSDDSTSTGSNEPKTDSTTISPAHDSSTQQELTTEPSSEVDSDLSGTFPRKDESPSDSAEPTPVSASDSATGRDESIQQPGATDAESGSSPIQVPSPGEDRMSQEIESLIARGQAGNPAVSTQPLRFDVRSTPPYFVPQPRLGNNHEYTGALGCCLNFFQGWQAYSLFISDSIFLIPFQLLLIAISISAIAMGFVNLGNCPMAKEIPFLVTVLGFWGLLAMILRLVFVLYFYCSYTLSLLGFQRVTITIVNAIFLMLYIAEMSTFYSYTASYEVGNTNYCHPVFHTYTIIYNWSLLLVVAVLFVLHFPAFLFNLFKIGGPGFPVEESQ